MAVLIALLVTPAAVAAPIEATLTAEPPLPTTAVYGSYWNLPFRSNYTLTPYDVISVNVTGMPGAADAYFAVPYSTTASDYFVDIYPKPDNRLIDVGSYTVSVNLSAAFTGATALRATTAVPQRLVISAAPITAALRVTPDSADPQNTVVAMSLGGEWITETICCDYLTPDGRAELDSVPAPPAGTWTMTIRNAAGETIVDQQFEQVRGAPPATPYLWMDAPIAENVTVEATFTATGEEAGNFTIDQPDPVTFTTGAASRPVIELPVVPEAPPVAVRQGVSVPVWALALAGLVGLGTALAAIVITILSRRAATPSSAGDDGVAGDESDGGDGGDADGDADGHDLETVVAWSLSSSEHSEHSDRPDDVDESEPTTEVTR